MTRKDFKILAETMAKLDLRPSVKLQIVEALASELSYHYPNFKRQLFIEVCMKLRTRTEPTGG